MIMFGKAEGSLVGLIDVDVVMVNFGVMVVVAAIVVLVGSRVGRGGTL